MNSLRTNLSLKEIHSLLLQWKSRHISDANLSKLLLLYTGVVPYMNAKQQYPAENFYELSISLHLKNASALVALVKQSGSFHIVPGDNPYQMAAFSSPIWYSEEKQQGDKDKEETEGNNLPPEKSPEKSPEDFPENFPEKFPQGDNNNINIYNNYNNIYPDVLVHQEYSTEGSYSLVSPINNYPPEEESEKENSSEKESKTDSARKSKAEQPSKEETEAKADPVEKPKAEQPSKKKPEPETDSVEKPKAKQPSKEKPEPETEQAEKPKAEDPEEDEKLSAAKAFFHQINIREDLRQKFFRNLLNHFQEKEHLTHEQARENLICLVNELLVPYFAASKRFHQISFEGRLCWLNNLLPSRNGEHMLRLASEKCRKRRKQAQLRKQAERRNHRPVCEYEWADPETGTRFYDDSTEKVVRIPDQAPPRPSATAVWNVLSQSWTEISEN